MENLNNNEFVEDKELFLNIKLTKIELFTFIVNAYEKMFFDRTRDQIGGALFIANLHKIMISNNKNILLYYIYYFLKYKYKELKDPHILDLKRLDNIYRLVYTYCNLDKKEKMQFKQFCDGLDNIHSTSYVNSDIVKYVFNTSLLNDKGELIIDESVRGICFFSGTSEEEIKTFDRVINTFNIKIRPPVENTIITEMMNYYGKNIPKLNSNMLNDFYKNNFRSINSYEITIYNIYEKYLLNFIKPNDIQYKLDAILNTSVENDESERLQNSLLHSLLTSYSFISIIKLLNDKAESLLDE